MRIAPRGEPFVLDFDQLSRDVPVGLVPPFALMTEYLNIDSQLVDSLQTLRTQD
jgi:hypothetical protein